MKAWSGKVYLAIGDTVNNAGPIDMNYIDTATNTLKTDTTSGSGWCPTCIDEEQIGTFREIDSTLVSAGRKQHPTSS